MTKGNPSWKDAVLAWTTVNLLFFRRWVEILPGSWDYFLASPSAAVYLSLMALVAALSAAAWGVVTLARRLGDPRLLLLVRIAFLLAVLLGAGGAAVEAWAALGRPRLGPWLRVLPWLAAGTVAAWLQWRHRGWHRRAVPVAVTLMLLLAPLSPILYGHATYRVVTLDAGAEGVSPPVPDVVPQASSGHRVVWIVFDELDQRLAFEDRPDGFVLPELDRLRAESLSATHAYAPDSATLRSVPAMTTGRLVGEATPQGADRLVLRFLDGEERAAWRDTDTVFDRAHADGHAIGIVGTYHPYCRLFAALLEACAFVGHYPPLPDTLAQQTAAHLAGLRGVLPSGPIRHGVTELTHLPGSLEQRQRYAIEKHERLQEAALDAVVRAELDLVYLHLSVPHPVGSGGHSRGFYDAATDRFVVGPNSTYHDNLVLADRTLGALRTAMERADTWNDTTLIVTSDHGYRSQLWGTRGSAQPDERLLAPTDHRVVFLVKPAGGDPDALEYDAPFNLILMHDLLVHGLEDGFATNAEVAAWLEAHRGFGPAPHYRLH